MKPFKAKFEKDCPTCGLKIRQGERALFNARDEMVHVKCVDGDIMDVLEEATADAPALPEPEPEEEIILDDFYGIDPTSIHIDGQGTLYDEDTNLRLLEYFMCAYPQFNNKLYLKEGGMDLYDALNAGGVNCPIMGQSVDTQDPPRDIRLIVNQKKETI